MFVESLNGLPVNRHRHAHVRRRGRWHDQHCDEHRAVVSEGDDVEHPNPAGRAQHGREQPLDDRDE